MSCQYKQSKQEVINLFYCSFEEDPSGAICEEIIDELLEEGFCFEELLYAQREASYLYSKNCF